MTRRLSGDPIGKLSSSAKGGTDATSDDKRWLAGATWRHSDLARAHGSFWVRRPQGPAGSLTFNPTAKPALGPIGGDSARGRKRSGTGRFPSVCARPVGLPGVRGEMPGEAVPNAALMTVAEDRLGRLDDPHAS